MTNPRGTLPPDTLLQNRYRILSQIGEGGMGAVYVATDERFGSTVALKETFFRDASLRRAFEREAQLLNRLRHHALPKVSDHFTEAEGQFLVMEFIAGDDLFAMLDARGGPFPAEDVLKWADDLLDALDYLHTQEPQIVHRDIKPQNLKLTPRGHIVLLDFGLAKGTPAQTSQATKSVFGYSRNYAPLEQIQGTGTDARSDIYSLGATLYHLLTGHVPSDALTRALAVLSGQPDPLRPADELNPRVSAAAASVITRALSQTAAARQQTAAEMREELRRAAAGEFAAVAPASSPTSPTLTAPRTTPATSEQETQLFGAHAARTNAQEEQAARETVRAGEVPSGETTMVGGVVTAAGDAPTRVMHGARATETFGVKTGAAGARDTDEQTVVSKRRGWAGRAAAAAVGLFVLCAGAFGLYKVVKEPALFTPNPPAQSAQPAAEAPQPSDAQDASAPPATTQGTQETPALAQPARPTSPTPAERRAASERAANRNSRREPDDEGEEAEADEDAKAGARQDPGMGVLENFNFNYNYNRAGQGMGVMRRPVRIPPGIDWEKLTPAQRRRLIQRIQRDAMREQQRANEEMRRRQQRVPPPPPPRPVPTPEPD